MKVVLEGIVMEKKELPFESREGGKIISYRLYQPGEFELVEVQFEKDGFIEGEKVMVKGKVNVRQFGKQFALSIRAERMEGIDGR